MNKIGIITIVKVNNYGAELQAFATLKKLQAMGHDAEIIDYIYYKNWRFKDTKRSRPLIVMSKKEKISYFIKYRIASFLIEQILPIFNINVKKRINNFNSFHKKYSSFSNCYSSADSLYSSPPVYDIYIVGSDQVWNPSALSSIEPYFLTFAPKGVKKISYASSFGVSELPKSVCSQYASWITNLDYISVRELSGVEIIRNLTNKNATLVCDPTLLLTKMEWLPYMNQYKGMPEKYVVIYQLSNSKSLVNLALRIGKEKRIPVFRICKQAIRSPHNKGIINILDAGPSEFLSIINNASFVVTDSFHGTIFSINLEIPFYTMVSAKRKNNSRMESILNYVGLMDRFIKDDININILSLEKYSYDNAHKQLEKLRTYSTSFLTQILRG